uniref:Flap endonuclease n=1 Tax=Marseillevirus LCMAC201 TaxID=2506605 RepID=A0A481YW53_9VIRU|nr:MAG: flap endonuclease [Marseillevirus LCMAC201]
MGIKDLCQFLRKTAPDLVVEVPLSSLSGQRLAVDASVYLYKFICIDNQFKGQWVDMFINFIVWLRKNNIRPVFVFDGKPPPQKERTQKERRANRHRIEQKVLELEELLETLSECNINESISADLKKRIDDAVNQDTQYWSRKEVMREINTRFKKENSKAIHIGPAENKKIQDLLTFIGLPWFKASGEAERTCAWLCKWGYVKGVVTTDSDVLAYGVPIFVQDVRVNQDTCKIIRHQDILEVLDLTEDQFRDFCIMCGTDYNERMPGIGPVSAYKLMCKHNDLDGMAMTTIDTSILHYDEGRVLFTLPPKDTPGSVIEGMDGCKFKIPAVKKIMRGELMMLLMKCNSRFTIDEIEMYTYQPKYVVN